MPEPRWNLSRKTLCASCSEPIWRKGEKVPDSWCAPMPDGLPRHFGCVYGEMAVTNGDQEGRPDAAATGE